MRNIEKGCIITLDDNNEYIVLRIKEYNKEKYAYIQNINNSEDDGFVLIENNKLTYITDKEIIKFLFNNM